ncbi:hypothetical protein DOM01_27990, partial [Salmonella enterica subsp. enterica serovar Derby]
PSPWCLWDDVRTGMVGNNDVTIVELDDAIAGDDDGHVPRNGCVPLEGSGDPNDVLHTVVLEGFVVVVAEDQRWAVLDGWKVPVRITVVVD